MTNTLGLPLQNFDLFVKMINSLPAGAIVKALDLECKTLETDLEFHRLTFLKDAFSIMCFRQFMRLAKQGDMMRCITPLPPEHVEFYRNTIVRLIQVDELPASAMKDFDFTFPASE